MFRLQVTLIRPRCLGPGRARTQIFYSILTIISQFIVISEILHSKCKQYGIPYCGTENVMSVY